MLQESRIIGFSANFSYVYSDICYINYINAFQFSPRFIIVTFILMLKSLQTFKILTIKAQLYLAKSSHFSCVRSEPIIPDRQQLLLQQRYSSAFSGVTLFFRLPGRIIAMITSKENYGLKKCHNFLSNYISPESLKTSSQTFCICYLMYLFFCPFCRPLDPVIPGGITGRPLQLSP